MIEYSKGPWTFDRWMVQDETGDVIAVCAPCWLSYETNANTRLIASAPELLEALKGLLELAEQMNDASDEGGQLDERYETAISAIQKAVQP